MSEFPREPRVSILNNDPIADLDELNIEDPDVSSAPGIICRQATLNIGLIGHVAHGKSTVVKSLSGVTTQRFKSELQRNQTIKLGYANAKIYRRINPTEPGPGHYRAFGSTSFVDARKRVIEHAWNYKDGKRNKHVVRAGPGAADATCNSGEWELFRHVSFVDCPGHEILMNTMLNGSSVMDAALLIVAANEHCPQPQTAEHLAAMEAENVSSLIIVQNKVDLVDEIDALDQLFHINEFVAGTVAEGAPVVPISAQLSCNMDVLAEYIARIPPPVRDLSSAPRMLILRSFSVNKPGQDVDHLIGGVVGGSLVRGILRKHSQVEIRPGLWTETEKGSFRCTPLVTLVDSLHAEMFDLDFAVPGGLIGVGTKIDPCLTRGDRLAGQVLGEVGTLPDIYEELEIHYQILERLPGAVDEHRGKVAQFHDEFQSSNYFAHLSPHNTQSHRRTPSRSLFEEKLAEGEDILINIGSKTVYGTVTRLKIAEILSDVAHVQLKAPVCATVGERLAISRRFKHHWRLIGRGEVQGGRRCAISTDVFLRSSAG